MRFRLPVLATAWLLVLMLPSLAQLPTPARGTAQALACLGEQYGFEPESTFVRDGQVLIRSCRDFEGNTHYFVQAPRPNRAGICRVIEREIFQSTPQDAVIVSTTYDEGAPGLRLSGWNEQPPEAWTAVRYEQRERVLGFVSSEVCPRGDDPRYVPLIATNDEVLKSFVAGWEKLAGSPEGLRTAMEKAHPAGELSPRNPMPRFYDAFAKSVFEKRSRIRRLYCEGDGCSVIVGGWRVLGEVQPGGINFTEFEILPSF